MILDRLSVLSDEISGDFTVALDWLVAQGLKYVEVRMVDGKNVAALSDAEIDRAKAEIDKRGLKVSAIASPLFKCMLDPSRPVPTGDTFGAKEEPVEAHLAKVPRAIEVAKKLGTDKIRIFSFWREKDPAAHFDEIAGHLKKAAEMAAKEGVFLLLENETACNGGYAAEVADLARRVGNPKGLRVLWDPGNETYGGKSPYPEGYAHVKGTFEHVHLKDAVVDPDGTPRCLPIGEGRAPLGPQIAALEKDGYRGLYTLETRYTPEGGTAMQGTERTLAGLKKLLADIA